MTGGSTDGSAEARSDGCAGNSPCGGILIDSLLRGEPDLLCRPLPANGVISLKLLKGLSRARHGHNIGTCGNGSTSGNRQHCQRQKDDHVDYVALHHVFTPSRPPEPME
jgi:hypothetical protein